MRALILAAVLVLSGCTATTVKLYPPQELLADCTPGILAFDTNEDVAVSAVRLAGALKLCNIDKKALRDWAKE